jgi:LmbE family N-acetylglucosaminyl deacetylase
MQSCTVFLFAHPDDEIGVMPLLAGHASRGEPVRCLYLTNGGFAGVAPERRQTETLRVLSALGLPANSARFIGAELRIPDGSLAASLYRALAAVEKTLASECSIGRFVFHAYEGGHQDHDATYAIGVCAALRSGTLAASRQFPMYRASLGPIMPYVMFRPLAENGVIERTPIPARDRLRYLSLLLSYRSQSVTLAGLMPLIAADYVMAGTQKLQPVSLVRLRQRPHPGLLLYERRGRATYSEVHAAISGLLEATVPDASMIE